MPEAITGLWAAVTTPTDGPGVIDHAALVRHAQRLVLCGSCGEGPSFSFAERLSAAEAVLGSGIAPERLAPGTGCPAIADSVALTRGTVALGTRAIEGAVGVRVAAILEQLEQQA